MPKIIYPKGYMEKGRYLDLYDEKLKYIGERMVYKYEGKFFIIKKDNKAYEVGLKQINKRVFAMIKPAGLIKTYIYSMG